MFESDDFDQVLSQFDIQTVGLNQQSDAVIATTDSHKKVVVQSDSVSFVIKNNLCKENLSNIQNSESISVNQISPKKDIVREHFPKHGKRKIINSHFNHKAKRKFPGPAGLLTGFLEETDNDSHMELLSQDIECTQALQKDLFESPLWSRLLEDVRNWNLQDINPIKTIKEQALNGNLERQKAQIVIAFIEAVDRSVSDPLIILRDTSGNIKCTLHRDAWSLFSPYIIPENCALVLCKPTVLTTGSAFKKHYLNITLSNIYAIFSTTVIKDGDKGLCDGYEVIYEETYTVIKSEKPCQDLGRNTSDTNNIFEDLDGVFADDLF